MFRLIRNKKGQNTAEYAILIGLVVAVAIAMQTYVKRGVQGRFADEVDEMAKKPTEVKDADWIGSTTQYEPDYLKSTSTTDTQQDKKIQTGTAKEPTINIGSEAEPNKVVRSGEEQLLKPQ